MPDLMPYLTAASWVATVCGTSAAMAAVLPQATVLSPSWWYYARRVIDVVGLNVFNAKNALTSVVTPVS